MKLNETNEDTGFGLVSTARAISAMVDELSELLIRPPSLYFDVEGINLSLHETISILQIHVRTTGKTSLVDMYTLQEVAFSTQGNNTSLTVKDIMESSSIPKVFFDVRSDSDALYNLYKIELKGIKDLQLMEFATRSYNKRFITGLKKCIARDMPMTITEKLAWSRAKDEGSKLFAPEKGGSYEVFNNRPLPENIRAYCVQDVHFLPRLWDLVKVEDATKARVMLSKSPDFNRNGQHMA
ncbi:ribonuclease H-like protein [Xylariaceae sp. FL0255]|nr:ribonuclease H-like protein [Xylariaceae sp. FL0255]